MYALTKLMLIFVYIFYIRFMKSLTQLFLALFIIICVVLAVTQYNSLILGTTVTHIEEAKKLYSEQLNVLGACIVGSLLLIYFNAGETQKK